MPSMIIVIKLPLKQQRTDTKGMVEIGIDIGYEERCDRICSIDSRLQEHSGVMCQLQRRHGTADNAVAALAARCCSVTRRGMAHVLVVVLGSFLLHRAPFRSTPFKHSDGLLNTGVYAGEISAAATLLPAEQTPLAVGSPARPVLVSGPTSAPDATTAKDKRPLPGRKVRTACRSILRVLFYVHSAPNRAHMRRLLRDTVETADKELRSRLKAEADGEGDMVQLAFAETYRNLTHKFISATKWLRANGCLNATEVVVKIDDAVMVNVFRLKSYISAYLVVGSPSFKTIHCCTMENRDVERGRRSKWYVTKEEYPGDKYPPYCAGALVIMRAAVLALLYEATERVPFFWIDDIYATGLLRRAANVSLVPINVRCNISPSIYTMVVEKALLLNLGTQPVLFTRAKQLWQSVMRQEQTGKRWSALTV